jgi:adenylylsulfate kinase
MEEGFVIWNTGLPSSGKSTIAKNITKRLRDDYAIPIVHVESDEIRKFLTPQPNYSTNERDWFYGVLGKLAQLLTSNGVNVIVDATANKRKYRDNLRSAIPKFLEVYVKCPIEICQQRDVKGIYRMAQEGKLQSVPGIQDPYEEPHTPELVIHSDRTTVEEAGEIVLRKLKTIGWI